MSGALRHSTLYSVLASMTFGACNCGTDDPETNMPPIADALPLPDSSLRDSGLETEDSGFADSGRADSGVADDDSGTPLDAATMVDSGMPMDAGQPTGDVELVRSSVSFAALLSDESILCWGRNTNGGACAGEMGIVNTIVPNLSTAGAASGAVEILSTETAFAAILSDGSALCWGFVNTGGICAGESDPTNLAETIDLSAAGSLPQGTIVAASRRAFAALEPDGSVACWGARSSGGACAGQGPFTNVFVPDLSAPGSLPSGTQLFANGTSFAALAPDGSVTCWGDNRFGGACAGQSVANSQVPDLSAAGALQPGSSIVPTAYGNLGGGAFAAVQPDGSVRCWGRNISGGICNGQNPPAGVVGPDLSAPGSVPAGTEVVAAEASFAALRPDGSVICWGDYLRGASCAGQALGGAAAEADLSAPGSVASGSTIVASAPGDSSHGAYAILQPDGSVICWGAYSGGACAGETVTGDNLVVDLSQPGSVASGSTLVSTTRAFAVFEPDGSAVCWGDASWGGACAGETRTNVISADLSQSGAIAVGSRIFSSAGAFNAVRPNGSVQCWGSGVRGGACAGEAAGSAIVHDLSAPGSLY